MEAGAEYTFELVAANYLGASAAATLATKKLAMPAPSLAIQGAAAQATTRSRGLTLNADSAMPALNCTRSNLSTTVMAYSWAEESGHGLLASDIATANPRKATLRPDVLEATRTYVFRVVAWMVTDPSMNNTAVVSVYVREQPLMALIAGGASRSVGTVAPLVLDGAATYDPDARDELAWSYAWTCARAADGAACDGAETFRYGARLPGGVEADRTGVALADAANLTVPVATLQAWDEGSYAFTLRAFRGSRNATATATVYVQPGSPPAVAIAALTRAKYSATILQPTLDARRLVGAVAAGSGASGRVDELVGPLVGDDAPDGTAAGLCASADLARAGDACVLDHGALSLSLSLSRLKVRSRATYTFELRATANGGDEAYATVDVDDEPRAARARAQRRADVGHRADRPVQLRVRQLGRRADDLLAPSTSSGTSSATTRRASTRRRTALDTEVAAVDRQTSASYTVLSMPEGAGANASVVAVAYAFDQFDAWARATAQLVVALAQWDAGALADAADALLATSLDEGDAAAAAQVISAVAGARNAGLGGQRHERERRAARDPGSRASAARARTST